MPKLVVVGGAVLGVPSANRQKKKPQQSAAFSTHPRHKDSEAAKMLGKQESVI